ncbi:MAG: phage late control D family protein, partial [Succinivibrio sp.]
KTLLSIQYIASGKETDISIEVSVDLLQCEYTDHIDDEADEVSITLKDEKGKWAGTWIPTRGDKVKLSFITETRGALETKNMIIDRLSCSGRPRVFNFSAVSIPLNGTVRRTIKTRKYENTTLKDIATQIATENELEFMWDCDSNPHYDKVDQERVSDLDFLKKQCHEAGFTVKVSAETLIIFDQTKYEKQEPIKILTENASHILSWSFEAQQSERYKSCTVRWRNISKKSKTGNKSSKSVDDRQAILDSYINGYTPNKGAKPKKGSTATKAEYIDYTYDDPNVDESGQVYILKKRCTSLAEAERLAKAKLRQLNSRQLTGSLTMVGDPLMNAGSVIKLVNFGSFDGNFIIEKATHTMSSSGYVTSIEVRRVNNEY